MKKVFKEFLTTTGNLNHFINLSNDLTWNEIEVLLDSEPDVSDWVVGIFNWDDLTKWNKVSKDWRLFLEKNYPNL